MVKLSLLFFQPKDDQAFENGYINNLALLEKMPGVQRRQACMVVGSPRGKSPYYRILEFYFDNQAALDAAMLSPEGRAAGKDLIEYAGDRVELVFSEVFEDHSL